VEKCVVVPYGVDFSGPELKQAAWRAEVTARRFERRQRGEPLHVLSVGSVGLRKGAPYFLAAAEALGRKARFRMVGSLGITAEAAERLRKHVELVGLVPRNEVQEHYRWAEVFLLPSVCEGSATVVYEALAHGLPVVCTPNTGSVVRDGVDGFIVPPSCAEPVVAALERILADAELWRSMSEAAFATSDQNDVKHYGKRLLKAVGAI
jgi:glycosyltransferase involved in cell wall biosynthesis